MAEYLSELETRVMIGVGAAFDLHTGRINDAPAWMKSAGLQWLHRLCQEPRRLWKRYTYNNPRFLYQVALQLLRLRTHDLSPLSPPSLTQTPEDEFGRPTAWSPKAEMESEA